MSENQLHHLLTRACVNLGLDRLRRKMLSRTQRIAGGGYWAEGQLAPRVESSWTTRGRQGSQVLITMSLCHTCTCTWCSKSHKCNNLDYPTLRPSDPTRNFPRPRFVLDRSTWPYLTSYPSKREGAGKGQVSGCRSHSRMGCVGGFWPAAYGKDGTGGKGDGGKRWETRVMEKVGNVENVGNVACSPHVCLTMIPVCTQAAPCLLGQCNKGHETRIS